MAVAQSTILMTHSHPDHLASLSQAQQGCFNSRDKAQGCNNALQHMYRACLISRIELKYAATGNISRMLRASVASHA